MFLGVAEYSNCQNQFKIDTIRTFKLDSLVWININKYRTSKSIRPFIVFEDSLMREYTKRVSEQNILIYPTKHSDSVGYWCNSECLYTYIQRGNLHWDEEINSINQNDFSNLAQRAVQGWVNSPSHNLQISREDIIVSTVYCIVIIDYKKKEFRFDATFHGLLHNENATFGNTYSYYISN